MAYKEIGRLNAPYYSDTGKSKKPESVNNYHKSDYPGPTVA